MQNTQLKIEGMSCAMCVQHVTHALENVAGVQNVSVDLEAGRADVRHESADLAAMIEAVDEAGYEAQSETQSADTRA